MSHRALHTQRRTIDRKKKDRRVSAAVVARRDHVSEGVRPRGVRDYLFAAEFISASFSLRTSSGVSFGGSSLMFTLSIAPVNLNGIR